MAPTGDNLMLLSDLGDAVGSYPYQLVTASNLTLTFDDDATGPPPREVVLSSGTYRRSNTGRIAGPQVGAASPYPSNIFVTGLAGPITSVTAQLFAVNHEVPSDFDILLSGPTPTQNLFLMSDAGGLGPVSDIDLTFDDAAAGPVPLEPITGTYRPTNIDSVDTMLAPAPTPSGATGLSTFQGSGANGTWSLWVIDDATGDIGSINAGRCLTIQTEMPTSTASPRVVRSRWPPTAPVRRRSRPARRRPASGASARCMPRTTCMRKATTSCRRRSCCSPTPVDLTRSSKAPASAWTARAPRRRRSSGILTATGSSTTPPGLPPPSPGRNWRRWASAMASTHEVRVRARVGAEPPVVSTPATLTVANGAPGVVLTGKLTATAGTPFTTKVGADDPSATDMAALFTYTVDWGDGSPVLDAVGPADPPVTHTYATAGSYTMTVTATDQDGDTGPALEAVVVVAAATAGLPATGMPSVLGVLLLSLLLLVTGLGAVRLARRH